MAIANEGKQVGIVCILGVLLLVEQLDSRHGHSHRSLIVVLDIEQTRQAVGRLRVILEIFGIFDIACNSLFPLDFRLTHPTQARVSITAPIIGLHVRECSRLLMQVGQRDDTFVVAQLIRHIDEAIGLGTAQTYLLMLLARRKCSEYHYENEEETSNMVTFLFHKLWVISRGYTS